MTVIVGLGNPGMAYENTRHNVGFKVIDKLSRDYNIKVSKIKHKAFIGEGLFDGKKIMLVKPITFMNLSGEAVKEIINYYKVPALELIIIFDDTSLPLGKTRVREKGSAGGHNGMKSIINHVGTDEILRIKVGIGEKPAGWELSLHVLNVFDKDEMPLILEGIDKACEAVKIILNEGIKSAMNKIN